MREFSRQVRIVLVRPRNPLNLLAAARAAANFGFDDVVIVSPYEPVWEEAQAATEAGKWLRKARRVASLPEAIEDRNWVLGTTSLARRKVEPQRVLSLDQFVARIRKDKRRDRIALLFGSEKRGLTNQALELCHSILNIPTSAATPSMNLGQAVAICCYELRRWGDVRPAAANRSPSAASVGEINRLIDELEKILPSAVMPRSKENKRQVRIRQLLMRWPLTSEDVVLLLGLIRDLRWRGERTS